MVKGVEAKTIVGLEVGTSKVVAVVGEVFPDGVVNVLGMGSCPSKGIDRGSITDLDAVVNSIQRAIEGAESMADCQIMSVTLAITGEHIQSLNESGFVPISDREVTQDEIDAALHTASSIKLPEGLSLLHIIPQEYAVDRQFNIKNPLGLQGVRLKAQVHLIACHQDWQNNLKKAVERCGLQVDKVVFSGFAATHSVLTEDEKDLGVCLIDFGAGTMNVMVYTNGALRFSKVIPYAGNIVTNDIAHACTISRAEAERVKVNYASAFYPARLHGDKKIEVASIGGRAPRSLTKSDLSLITSARYTELLGVVKDELDKLKKELEAKHIKFELIAGVVITGGGGNAVNHMVMNMVKQEMGGTYLGESTLTSEEHGRIIFYAVNTDAQALRKSHVQQTVQIGGETTKGLGAGANPNIGRKAAEDDQEEIRKMLEGADMVFIAAGMGGGTGTGAAPVVARIAKELGILTVAVVTKPFAFEGKKRMQFAELGIKDLAQYVDSMIIIPNQQIQKVLPKNAKLIDAFAAANDVLRNSVMGISDMITSPGLINVDFADVRTVMSEMGQAMIGFGSAVGSAGEGRAEEAARIAVRNDLLEKIDLSNAKGILVNITAGMDLSFEEFNIVGETVGSFASEDATVVIGTSLVPEMTDEIRVTIVATGLGDISVNEPIQVVRPVRQPQDVNIVPDIRRPEPVEETKTVEEEYHRPLDKPITDRLDMFKNNAFFNPAAQRDENSSN